MWTEPGTLAFPTVVPAEAVPRGPDQVIRFTIEERWHDWLLRHYAHALDALKGVEHQPAELLNLLGTATSGPSTRAGSGAAVSGPLPSPCEGPARVVALALLEDPASDLTQEQWSAYASCSPSTLSKAFLRETGLTFGRWRSQMRMGLARRLLADGRDVQMVASRTGFASRRGFAHAFRRHHGISARDYVTTVALETEVAIVNESVSVDLPGWRTSPRVNDFHVLTWTYAGRGFASVEGETLARHKSDAVWLPAGSWNQTSGHVGSIGLPLAFIDGDTPIRQPLRTRFPESWSAFLLHVSISSYTLLRPERFDRRYVLDLFQDRVAIERARSVPMPTGTRAREAANDFLRRVGTSAENGSFVATVDVRDAFRRETGMTFACWRHAARMRIARDLLVRGMKPSGVARRVGYAHLSNFSRAFSSFHGVSPQDYQARKLG